MITVHLFGMTKMMAGNQAALSLPVADGGQVKDLVGAIEAAYPEIGELIQKKKVLVSVNQDIAHDETVIHAGDEIALLPPFAGGSPQGVETGRQHRPHIAQGLNVWEGDERCLSARMGSKRAVQVKLGMYLLVPSLAAALLINRFEHPASREGDHA